MYALPVSLTSYPNAILTMITYIAAGTEASISRAAYGHEQNITAPLLKEKKAHNCITFLLDAMNQICQKNMEIPVTPMFVETVLRENGFKEVPLSKEENDFTPRFNPL